TQILDRRNLREPLRIARQIVEERFVELLVDESRTRPLNLMRHAACAEDHDVQILVPALDGLLDSLAEVVAAVARGCRILDDVDRERNHAHGPRLRLAE